MITLHLSQNDFKINNVSLKFPIDIKILKKVLIASCRINKKKYNTIYTWDELGILGYSKDGVMIDSISLELQQENFDFSAKETFKGFFYFDTEEIVSYYKTNKDRRVKLFDGDSSGALILNDISVWFDTNKNEIDAIEIKAYQGSTIKEIPKDTYTIKELNEEEIIFTDFGFKLSVIQELMYNKELITPKFDLFEFVIWYSEREINLEEEGYEPIEEVTQYFRDLPIPKRLAPEITEIYQDGGNEVYLNLLRFAEGWEEYWDIESIEDAKNFPNLKKATLCYAKQNIIGNLKEIGIDADWL